MEVDAARVVHDHRPDRQPNRHSHPDDIPGSAVACRDDSRVAGRALESPHHDQVTDVGSSAILPGPSQR